MSKKPSAETQLKTLKAEFLRLRRSYDDVCKYNIGLKHERDGALRRLDACDTERRHLLDAMCAHMKRAPAANTVTNDGTGVVHWKMKPRGDGYSPTLHAIKSLRNATQCGLAEAKRFVEQGSGALTDVERTALEPHVEFFS